MPIDKVPLFDVAAHTYTDPVDHFKYTSVTRWVEKFKPHFDEQVMAKRIASREGVSVQCILEMWEEKREASKAFGTRVHKLLEMYHKTGKSEDAQFNIILDNFNKLGITFAVKNTFYEKLVYSRTHGIAGMSDMIMHHKNGTTFDVYDFKTNKKLRYHSPFNDQLLAPLTKFPCSEYFTYALQLSMYAYLYKLMSGLEPLRLKIFWYARDKPEDYSNLNGEWHIIDVPYLEDDIIKCLHHKKN